MPGGQVLANSIHESTSAHTSTFAQATAARYLRAGRMPATLRNVRNTYGERARVMGESLKRKLGDAIEFTLPQGGLFSWSIEQGAAFVPARRSLRRTRM